MYVVVINKYEIMSLKIFILLSFFTNVSRGSNEDILVVSTSETPHTQNHQNCVSRDEFYAEMRTVVNLLNSKIIYVQRIKSDLLEEVEKLFENKFKSYNTQLMDIKNDMHQSTEKIIMKAERRTMDLKDYLKSKLETIEQHISTKTKEILDELTKSDESTSDFKSNLNTVKNEIIEEVQNQLTNQSKDFQNKLTFETDKSNSRIQLVVENSSSEIKKEISSHLTKVNFDAEIKFFKTQLNKTKTEIVSQIQQCQKFPNDCDELQKRGNTVSGIYRIDSIVSSDDVFVYCDMETDGGGWTYVLHRFDGSQNFFLPWADYKKGFGDVSKEFWLGLETLYQLTNNKPNEIRFELTDQVGKKVHANYDNFKIGKEADGYNVTVLGKYSGNAGDSFRMHFGKKFSTKDKDKSQGCLSTYKGSWWYGLGNNCFQASLTQKYTNSTPKWGQGIHWNAYTGLTKSLKEVKMMIRPKRH